MHLINVPMSFEEKAVLKSMMKNKKWHRLARPVSLIITLIVVVSVIGWWPECFRSWGTLLYQSKGYSHLCRKQSWAEEIFHNNKEIKEWLDSLTLIGTK